MNLISRRRTIINTIAVAFVWLTARAALPLPAAESFTVVVLPDTQCYCDTRVKYSAHHWKNGDLRRYFIKQTEWARDNRDRLNISFLVHEGDIVQTDYPEEWEIAKSAMAKLDGKVPYCLCLGNHDMGFRKTGKNEFSYVTAEDRKTRFNEYFPREKFAKTKEFGGTFDQSHDNSWYQFEQGDLKFMVLSLEFQPRDEVLAWAGRIVRQHPDHRVIVLTHSYLDAKNQRTRTGYAVKGNLGEQMWQKFVRKHKNIFMVLCGHVLGEGRLTSAGDHGNPVHQLLSDYQGMNNGGESWLRYLVFHPDKNKIEVFTYNPALDKFRDQPSSRFDLEYPMSR
jgi:predicted MPP superfamily phosphohydrolase